MGEEMERKTTEERKKEVENHHHLHHHREGPGGTPQRNRSRADQSKSGRMRDLAVHVWVLYSSTVPRHTFHPSR